MTDLWNRLVEKLHLPKWMDHQRFTLAGACVFGLAIAGCTLLKGKTDSITTEGKRVSQPQLEMEIAEQLKALEGEAIVLKGKGELLAQKAAFARSDLYENQQNIDRIVGAAKLAIGSFIPPGGDAIFQLIVSAIGGTALIGGGAMADGRRKDRVITALKNDAALPPM